MSDLTEIAFDSEFAKSIRACFEVYRPETILETGLYHGNGSTAIIASLIRDLPIPEAVFYSVECNREFIDIAYDNLEKLNLSEQVSVVHGLSIPKLLLPSLEEIKAKISESELVPGIVIDHRQDPDNAANYYSKESLSSGKDDCIGRILEAWKNNVDFVFLDSGGHIGDIEFKYLISKLQGPCVIGLDDTRHLKHYKSLKIIKEDKRFEVISEGDEKFGFCIARFFP